MTPFLQPRARVQHRRGVQLPRRRRGWQRWLFIGIARRRVRVHRVAAAARRQPLFCAGLALILGGALGNLFDRLLLGAVVDFLLFHYARLALAGVQRRRQRDHRAARRC